ncbi:hypothetical protein COCON_G00184590 [Conger conger]|uniref:Uncharacterized protein n=1 Tax=Conger conger TaxID=82655 RepID=A0A9Q1HRP2_CONCO|nr:hypothetical protein COCON_G00184590 [Conger conger]
MRLPGIISGNLVSPDVDSTTRGRHTPSLAAPGPKGDPGEDYSEGEGVQQLRDALKILAERVLILEHMIGVHESPLDSGSGLAVLADPTPLPAVKIERVGPVDSPSLLQEASDLIGQNLPRRGDN